MRRGIVRFAALLVMLVSSPFALAENDQTVVLGFGFGIHSFSETDDFREGILGFDDLSSGGHIPMYAEWYAWEELGIGFRLMPIRVFEEVRSWSGTYERTIKADSGLFTINWVPFGASRRARLGLFAGLGPSHYSYEETIDGTSSYKESSDGVATLIGAYVDWGGRGFGGRATVAGLETDLDAVDGKVADASGVSLSIEMRWAIE